MATPASNPLDRDVELIQFAYPQIYYACHTRHVRRRSSAVHLSARDSEVLVHLDRAAPTSLSALARHMDLAPSTLSEAISTLEGHGYVAKAQRAGADRRHVGLTLTPRGVEAVKSASVLEARRVRDVLRRMRPADRRAAIDGLVLFARACTRSA